MQIKNDINQNISYKGIDSRNIIKTLSNSDSLTSTVCLETFVTGGRGYNAYKRGGVDEFRERTIEDVSAAVFWMKGVDIFNSIGNKFGKKVLKLPTTDFDVGKDALRNPFQNLSFDYKNEKNAKGLIKKLAVFKFTKIILSTLLSTMTIGYVIPKVNQKITENVIRSRQIEKKTFAGKNIEDSFEEFTKRISLNKNPSFKGNVIDSMIQVSHTLENNTICKMLTNDAGIISGRAINARNKDEAIEYIFRDCSSLFFYFASTPLIYKGLQKLTNSKNLTELDPVAAKTLHEELLKQVNNNPMKVEEFEKKTIGILDENSKKILDKLKFNKDVILLDNFIKQLKDEDAISRAQEMSKLQPELKGKGRVLTKQQVIDVLKNTSITSSEFQHKIFKEKFEEKLYDKYRYISMKKITSFRDNIDKYIQAVLDTAKSDNNGTVDKELLERINKESFSKASKFRIFSMLVSALSLGFLIPKLQYAITQYRTGSNKAPGFRKFENSVG